MAPLVKCRPRKHAGLHSGPRYPWKTPDTATYVCNPRAGGVYSDSSSRWQASIASQWGTVGDRVEDPRSADDAGWTPPVCLLFWDSLSLSVTDWLYWRYWSGAQSGLCVVRTLEEKERRKVELGGETGLRGALLGACLGRQAWPHAAVCENGQLGHLSPAGHSLWRQRQLAQSSLRGLPNTSPRAEKLT